MNGEAAEQMEIDRAQRGWLLECEGMRVDGPTGAVGEIVTPLYEFSARWDRPWGLAIRTGSGSAIVHMDAVESVDSDSRRIVVREAPLVDLARSPMV
jgi:hypothetical protein